MNPAVLSSETSLFVTFLASFLVWIMFTGLVFLWIVDGRIKKELVLHAMFAILISWGIAEMIKSLFPTIRPFELNGSNPLTITIPMDASFPSVHTAVAFACAVSIFRHNKKLGMKFIILAFLVGAGRLLGNVHTLADVMAGGIIGTSSALFLGKLHVFKLLNK